MGDVLKLNDGRTIPAMGFGTWQAPPGVVGASVIAAVEAGYRHIDCAALYGNEKEIGEAFEKIFKEGKVKREDLFITSKLWNTDWDNVKGACQKTLADLRLTYLDLYLVHTPASWEKGPQGEMWYAPMKMGHVPMHVMWREMEALVGAGLAKSIGVSNFLCITLHDLLTYAKIKPVCNQIEVHPFLQQKENREYCESQGIVVVAYSPLGNAKDGGPLKDALVAKIAEKHKVQPAQVSDGVNVRSRQVLIRWSIQHGVSVLPKSTTPSRIAANFNVFGLKLDEEDMKALDGLEQGLRTCNHEVFWKWPCYH